MDYCFCFAAFRFCTFSFSRIAWHNINILYYLQISLHTSLTTKYELQTIMSSSIITRITKTHLWITLYRVNTVTDSNFSKFSNMHWLSKPSQWRTTSIFIHNARQIDIRTYKISLMQFNSRSLVHHFQSLMFIAKLNMGKQWFKENCVYWLIFVTYVYL